MVRTALVVPHSNRRPRLPPDRRNHGRVARRDNVLNPAETQATHSLLKFEHFAAGSEDHVRVEADPCLWGSSPNGLESVDGELDRRGDRHLEPPPTLQQKSLNLSRDVSGADGRRVTDDGSRRHRSRLSPEVGDDRLAGHLRCEVPGGDVNDRERAHADPRGVHTVVGPQRAVKRLSRSGATRANVDRRDGSTNDICDWAIARQAICEATQSTLGIDAHQRKLTVSYLPLPKDDGRR